MNSPTRRKHALALLEVQTGPDWIEQAADMIAAGATVDSVALQFEVCQPTLLHYLKEAGSKMERRIVHQATGQIIGSKHE